MEETEENRKEKKKIFNFLFIRKRKKERIKNIFIINYILSNLILNENQVKSNHTRMYGRKNDNCRCVLYYRHNYIAYRKIKYLFV